MENFDTTTLITAQCLAAKRCGLMIATTTAGRDKLYASLCDEQSAPYEMNYKIDGVYESPTTLEYAFDALAAVCERVFQASPLAPDAPCDHLAASMGRVEETRMLASLTPQQHKDRALKQNGVAQMLQQDGSACTTTDTRIRLMPIQFKEATNKSDAETKTDSFDIAGKCFLCAVPLHHILIGMFVVFKFDSTMQSPSDAITTANLDKLLCVFSTMTDTDVACAIVEMTPALYGSETNGM